MSINAATLREVIRYGAAFSSSTALAANTPETIVAPASNVNGLVVWDYQQFLRLAAVGYPKLQLIARTTAPTGPNQGDVLCQADKYVVQGTDSLHFGRLQHPVHVAAGKGLYFLSDVAEVSCNRLVLYTLL